MIKIFAKNIRCSDYHQTTAKKSFALLVPEHLSEEESIHLDLETFVATAKTFKPNADISYFGQLMKSVTSVKIEDSDDLALLARVVLFDHDDDVTMKLTDSKSLIEINKLDEMIFESMTKKNKNAEMTITLKDLMRNLVKMSVFCSYNLAKNESGDPFECVMAQAIDIPYTSDEESWISLQVNQLEAGMKSVQISESILDEIAMFLLGVPFSKRFFAEAISVGNEKMWKMFLTQQEFLNLPVAFQSHLKQARVSQALALSMARTESLETGSEQLEFSFGVEDQNVWTKKFDQIFGGNSLNRIPFFQSLMSINLPMGAEVSFIGSFVTEASKYTKDRMQWGIMLLIMMTHPLASFSHPLAVVNSQYEILLQRRLRWIQSKESFNWTLESPEVKFSKMMSAIRDADKVGDVLKFAMQIISLRG